jgi:hypothetical protein
MAEIRINETGTLKLFDADDSHSASIKAGTISADVASITLESGETVFNEDSADIDFRVESNGNANMIFVDGGNNHVNIGTATDLGGVLNVSGTGVFQTADNTNTLSLVCTDEDATSGPRLSMRRESASPADSDNLGQIYFTGKDSAGNNTDYVTIKVATGDVTDGTEDAQIEFDVVTGGTAREYMRMAAGANPAVIINQDSRDINFQVLSDGNDNMLFVDAGNDRVGIGTNSPDKNLQLESAGNTEFRIENSSDSVIMDIQALSSEASIRTVGSHSLTLQTAQTERFRVTAAGKVGIGEVSPLGLLHLKSSDSGASVNSNRDDFIIENSGHCGMTILSGTSNVGGVAFGDSGGNLQGLIQYNHSTDNFEFNTNSTQTPLVLNSGGQLSTNAEVSPDVDAGGLCLNQGANDDQILTLKSSDINAGSGVSGLESDTYAAYKKLSATAGGLLTQIQSEIGECHETRALIAEGTVNTTKSTSANAPIIFKSAENHSGGIRALSNAGTNSNLFIIADHTTRRFIFDSEGDLHSDSSNTTFDSYEDAHLVRAFDLSHGRGVIDSKFDEFVKYKHEDLANIGLVGREDDGTPNHFINITGFQRLHNGAIWQQYEKHQRLAEAVYEMAKEALGEDKADAILKKHDIKLLN